MKTKFIILTIIGAILMSSISTALVLKHSFCKRHFGHFKKIEKNLELSEEQSLKLKNLILENAPKAMEILLFEKDKEIIKKRINNLHREGEQKLQEILTPQQFEKFKKLKGKRFLNRCFKKRCTC